MGFTVPSTFDTCVTATMVMPALDLEALCDDKPLEEESEGSILAMMCTWPVVWIGVALSAILCVVDGWLLWDTLTR